MIGLFFDLDTINGNSRQYKRFKVDMTCTKFDLSKCHRNGAGFNLLCFFRNRSGTCGVERL